MKGVTTGIIGVSAIGASKNVSADIPWTTLSGVGLAYESSAVALDYLMGDGYVDEVQNRVANYIHYRYGDMRNYDGYTGGSALHTEVLAGAKEMQISHKQIMNGIQNQIEMSDNVGYSKGKVALVESLNAGDDITQAKSKMNDAINDYYSTIQRAIIKHYIEQLNQMWHMNRKIDEHSELEFDDPSIVTFYASRPTNSSWIEDPSQAGYSVYSMMTGKIHSYDGYESWSKVDNCGYADFELLNGEMYENVPVAFNSAKSSDYSYVVAPYYDNFTNGSNSTTLEDMSNFSQPHSIITLMADVDTTFSNMGSEQASSQDNKNKWMDFRNYMNAMDSLYTARDRVNSNLQGFADDLYSQYQSGDLSFAEIVDPITYATEMASDVDNDAFRQVSAAQLGFATNATENVTIQINDGDSEPVIETDLYTSYEPNNGNWQVGTQYDPSTWSEPLFITYPDTDGENSMAQLETPFTIQSAVDKDGNSVDTFQNRETNIQTADITKIQEQLEDLRQTQLELQQDSGTSNTDTPQDSDGGSGGSSTNIVDELTKKYFGFPLYGWIAGGGVVTYVGTKVGNE